MTDIHTHILHGIDDGPSTLSDSIKLIAALAETGIKRIAATSHYYAAVESKEEFIKNRTKKIIELETQLNNNGIDIKIIPGAEILMDRLILNHKDLKDLCYNGNRYALLEIPHANADYNEYIELIERIMSYYNIIPVVAHVERYPYFAKSVKNVEYLKDMGCKIQLDAQCFLGSFMTKHFGHTLLKKGLVDVIGSDCHDLAERGPNLHGAYSIIKKKHGIDTVNMLMENAETIIR